MEILIIFSNYYNINTSKSILTSDRLALSHILNLKERKNFIVKALIISDSFNYCDNVLREALAMGVDDAYYSIEPNLINFNIKQRANILKNIVNTYFTNVEIIFFGKNLELSNSSHYISYLGEMLKINYYTGCDRLKIHNKTKILYKKSFKDTITIFHDDSKIIFQIDFNDVKSMYPNISDIIESYNKNITELKSNIENNYLDLSKFIVDKNPIEKYNDNPKVIEGSLKDKVTFMKNLLRSYEL